MQHIYYQSLLRRIPSHHEIFPIVEERIHRTEAGIFGESLVTRELSEMTHLPFEWVTNFQFISQQNISYQIDFILILHNCIVVLEVKNISGTVRYLPHSHEFQRIRTTGEIDTFRNPFDQALRHQHLVKNLLSKIGISLPIVFAVIMANAKCKIDFSLQEYPIFHLSYLRRYLSNLKFPSPAQPINIHTLKEQLLNFSQVLPPQKLISYDELTRGIICIKCKSQMYYRHGTSTCSNCCYKSRLAIFETIRDYYLLVGDHITNGKFRWFSLIDSKHTASKILSRLKFEKYGKSCSTTYLIPPQFVYSYQHIRKWQKKDG